MECAILTSRTILPKYGFAAFARYLPFLISSVMALSILTGCAGTTHHFLPPRPLDKNEVMIAWTWNYDFDQWNVPTLSPGMNLYAGLGNGDNIGAGLQFLGITHISYAKYLDEDRSSKRFYYLTLNQPIGSIYNNPYIELGGGKTTYESGVYHSASVGLGFGHGMSYSIMGILPREASQRDDSRDFTHIWRLIPIVKYTAIGTDVGASLSYHHGKAKLIYDNLANAITNFQDTILHIPAEQIDSVGQTPELVSWWHDFPAIFLKNDSIIHISTLMSHNYQPEFFATWAPLFYSTDGYYSKAYVAERRFFGSVGEIYETVESGGDLLITKYPKNALDHVSRPRSLFRDISIGFADTKFRRK